MRSLTCLAVIAALFLAGPAAAENRTFVIASAPDGYGVDQCLATAARCGSLIADMYCQGQDFSRAASFRPVGAAGVTTSVATTALPAGATWVEIECTR